MEANDSSLDTRIHTCRFFVTTAILTSQEYQM